MFEYGKGFAKDYAEAVRLYRLAAAQGHEYANRLLRGNSQLAPYISDLFGSFAISRCSTFTRFVPDVCIRVPKIISMKRKELLSKFGA